MNTTDTAKKNINTKPFRYFILFLLVLSVYWPYLLGVDLGAGDAQHYHSMVASAIEQIDKGIFPPYVNQGVFSYFGYTYVRSPYLFLFSQFLHLLTFGLFDSLYILHFTVLISAICAAFLTYHLLMLLTPNSPRPWTALFLSYLYISCPGIVGTIYAMDMYYSFMTLPMIPLLIYSLIRANRRDDFYSYVLIAASLSLLYLAHPPIALVATVIAGLVLMLQWIFFRIKPSKLFLMASCFILFSLWQFYAVHVFQAGSVSTGQLSGDNGYGQQMVNTLWSEMPGVFKPLRVGHPPLGTAFLQLGYSLWLVLLAALWVTLRRSPDFVQIALIASIGLILIYLYPPPALGPWLWNLIPSGAIRNILFIWPNQRLYYLLSVLVCFAGYLSLNKISGTKRQYIVPILIGFCCWNFFENGYFIHRYDTNRVIKTQTDKENVVLLRYDTRDVPVSPLFEGNYDPLIKNRLLDQNYQPISSYDNEQILLNRCASQEGRSVLIKEKLPIPAHFEISSYDPKNLFDLTLPAGKYFFCLKVQFDTTNLNAINETHLEILGRNFPAKKFNNNDPHKIQTYAMPITLHDAGTRQLVAQLQINTPGSVDVLSYGLIPYDLDSLPVQTDSEIPNIVNVYSPSANNYLEIFKTYYPGYIVRVNDRLFEPLKSPLGRVLIPLDEGNNYVKLSYIGTSGMKLAFGISASAWVLFLGYFAYPFGLRIYRKIRREYTFIH